MRFYTRFKVFLPVGFLLFFNMVIYSQSPIKHLNIDSCRSLQLEKVYVHLAENTVATGDNIYFKAYLNSKEKIHNQSSILYFDIINEKGKVIQNWCSKLTDGYTAGNTKINDTTSTGLYILRAYSKWMLNTGSDFIFQKPILLINLADENLSNIKKTLYLNQENSSYLSSIANQRVSLISYINNDSLLIKLENLQQLNNNYTLIASLHGEVILKKDLSVNNNSYLFQKSIEKYESGIINILLVDDNENIVVDKAVVYRNNKAAQLAINLTKDEYLPGEKIVIPISAKGIENTDVLNLSCSVTEKNSLDFISGNNSIIDYINILSEYKVNTWFYNNPTDTLFSTLTIGNSIWEKTNSAGFDNCSFVKEVHTNYITGRISNKYTNVPLVNKMVMLSIPGNNIVSEYAVSDSEGEFYFWLNDSLKNAQMILQVFDNTLPGEHINWEINNNIAKIEDISLSVIGLQPENKADIENLRKISLINRVYNDIPENKTPEKVSNYSEISFKPSYTIFPAEYDQLENFKDLADNVLPGVSLKKKHKNWVIQLVERPGKSIFDTGSFVFVNGIPCQNLEIVSKMPVNEIERIDVYQYEIFYGDFNFKGIVAIYLKDLSMPVFLRNSGYLMENKILSDDFSPVKIKSSEPALNNLLYWNPAIKMRGENLYTIELVTPDYPGTFEIKIAGLKNRISPVEANKIFTIR